MAKIVATHTPKAKPSVKAGNGHANLRHGTVNSDPTMQAARSEIIERVLDENKSDAAAPVALRPDGLCNRCGKIKLTTDPEDLATGTCYFCRNDLARAERLKRERAEEALVRAKSEANPKPEEPAKPKRKRVMRKERKKRKSTPRMKKLSIYE